MGHTVAHWRRGHRLECKDHIFKVEYLRRQRTTVAVYEVSNFLIDENIVVYMFQYGEIVGASHDDVHGEWRFDLSIHSKQGEFERALATYHIVSGRKLACWLCRETGHFSANHLEKASVYTRNSFSFRMVVQRRLSQFFLLSAQRFRFMSGIKKHLSSPLPTTKLLGEREANKMKI